jgi:cytochrome c556
MIRFTRLAAGVGTALAVVLSLSVQAHTYDPMANAAAQEALNKLSNNLGNAGMAQGIAKDVDIADTMHLFKPRNKGGFGIGPKPPDLKDNIKDSIELTIIDLANDKKGFDKDVVNKYGADLVKAAKQTQAIAEVNTYYAPTMKKGDKDPKDWKQFNDEMKAGAADLAKAAQAKDAAGVKAAANKLNNACVKCHEKFRD